MKYKIDKIKNFRKMDKEEKLDKLKEITGKEIKFYEEDVCNEDAIRKIFEENKIDAVMHFAGLKAVGESVKKPLEYSEKIGGI